MTHRFDTISFLSDFGITDEFVGVVKSVIADIAPHARVIDLVHEIAPFDVRAGSLALARCIPYVPQGVILAIVDPGVGSSRRGVAISVAGGTGIFVGPDNGLLAAAIALAGGAQEAVVLNNSEYQLAAPGNTFAGRDIFAPAAAYLCNGVPLSELGEEIDPDLLLPGVVPLPVEKEGGLQGEVTWIDRFGNCQLNISLDDIAGWGDQIRVVITNMATSERVVRSLRVVDNFSRVAGGVGLVVDSNGMLAICVDRGSAALELHLGPSDLVALSPDSPTARVVTTNVHIGRKNESQP
ncbi:MAG: SAM hydrolase/SAM-dependent halogenase family protein [Ilumatobacteraceae bacterium]